MGRRGPKTEVGKAMVAVNAVRHGLLARMAVVPGVERQEDWEAHRSGVLQNLEPGGFLEERLAERIALCLWRLERVARHERELIALRQQAIPNDYAAEAPMAGHYLARSDHPEDVALFPRAVASCQRLLRRLAQLPSDQPILLDTAACLLDLALQLLDGGKADASLRLALREQVRRSIEAEDWTAGKLNATLSVLARHDGCTPEEFLVELIEFAGERLGQARAEVETVEQELELMRRKRLLPKEAELDKIIRYEAHLSREFYRSLHELEAIQARRHGQVTPLARLEVNGPDVPGSGLNGSEEYRLELSEPPLNSLPPGSS